MRLVFAGGEGARTSAPLHAEEEDEALIRYFYGMPRPVTQCAPIAYGCFS
jgi:hypothetical protein